LEIWNEKGLRQRVDICESCNERLELSKARVELVNLQESLRVAHEALKRLTVDRPLNTDAPLPIAYAYNMVKAEIDPMLKMERLRRALGIVLRYFASIVFADYHAKGCFDESTNAECREVFSKPVTEGSWFQATIKVAESYKSSKVDPALIKEIPLWQEGNKKLFKGLCHGLIQLRNEVHDKVLFDKSSAGAWLEKALPKWDGMMEASAPLMFYKLMYVESIEDFLGDKDILYHVKCISGEHLIPKSELVRWPERLKKGKLYIVDVDRGASLDLAPFMAYEFSIITRTKEAYCIEQVNQGKIEFATLRFPHKEQLAGYSGPIFTKR
jgi:hypothetical protein